LNEQIYIQHQGSLDHNYFNRNPFPPNGKLFFEGPDPKNPSANCKKYKYLGYNTQNRSPNYGHPVMNSPPNFYNPYKQSQPPNPGFNQKSI